jgi:hypothetical protein
MDSGQVHIREETVQLFDDFRRFGEQMTAENGPKPRRDEEKMERFFSFSFFLFFLPLL